MRVGALIVLAGLVACAGPPPTPTTTPEPELPLRPAVPPLWRNVRSDAGELQLVVPPDLVVFHTSGSIHAMRDGDAEVLTVAAVSPGQLVQPRGDQTAAEWADDGGWLTAGQGSVGDAPVRSREVLLPAGPAIELTTAYELGGAGTRWTMLYVIRTANGYGLLQVGGPGQPPDELPDEVRLMRELIAFD